ncbi:MAG: hypothetical protein N3A63_07310 [Bacteroidetes bacterium]|nr:hypothetical protein [Bacteroidota bacterium]
METNNQDSKIIDALISVILQSVGVVCLLIAISTFVEFSAFTFFIASTLHISSTLAMVVGSLILVVEFAGGVILCLRKYSFLFLVTLLCTFGFLLILSFLNHVNRTLLANLSLGFIYRFFSNEQMFILQLGIIGVLVLFGARRSKNIKTLLINFGMVVLLSLALVREYRYRSPQLLEHTKSLSRVLNNLQSDKQLKSTRAVIIFLQYNDFNCPPCMENIYETSFRIASELQSQHSTQVMVFMREDEVMFNQTRVDHWKSVNNYPFAVTWLPDSLFTRLGLQKSSIVILEDRQILLQEKFPLNASDINKVVTFLR